MVPYGPLWSLMVPSSCLVQRSPFPHALHWEAVGSPCGTELAAPQTQAIRRVPAPAEGLCGTQTLAVTVAIAERLVIINPCAPLVQY